MAYTEKRMENLISPERARQIVLENCATLPAETRRHAEVLGFTLARDIVASLDLPPFDNSSVDGFALVANQTRAATPQTPQRFSVRKTIAAGDASENENDENRGTSPENASKETLAPHFEYSISSSASSASASLSNSNVDDEKTCVKIMTGAPMPAFADAVLMREDTDESEVAARGVVQIFAAARCGQNVRFRASDVARGETVLRAGTKIGAAQWSLLASLGCAQIEVFRRPRVGIIATGNEIVGVDAPLQSGQIRDSNSSALRALVQECDAVVLQQKTSRDNAEDFRAMLLEMLPLCDVIVTAGGVSAGDFDVVRDVLPQIARLHFWKIAMKPGKPVMFATHDFAAQNGEKSREIPIFGLPGNPVSAMVSFERFVRPALLKMQGRRALERVQLQVRVLDTLRSPSGRTEFARAFVAQENGEWTARLDGDQGSGRLSTMTNSNALLEIPAETTRIESGDFLRAFMTDWPE